MRRFSAVTLAVIAALVLPALGSAQSLGELAAREREKRKAKSGAAAKTYSDGDLGSSSGLSSAEPAAESSDPSAASPQAKDGAAAPKKEKTEEELQAEREKAWRERLAKAGQDLARITARIDTLQRSLGDISQQLYGATRTAQLNELENLKREQATTQQALTDLEEEGRRSGWRP
jgi:hypothetical protein